MCTATEQILIQSSPHTCQGPNPGQGYSGHHTFSEGRFMGWCGKGGLGTGDPACHDSHSPINPSCLRVPGLTLETQFGLPVCPAGGSQAYIRSHHPTPTSPGPEARWPSRYCWCQELGPGRQGKGWRMCLPLAVPGVESRARQAGVGRGPVRGVLAVPAACPHSTPPTMAPLFPVARQFGGGSSATHAPLNRGQINPLGDGTR